jgi:hypothetical protein
MAWTTPKTWVDQETVSADDFNTQIRDNLDSIAGHTHTGTAGDGSATLGSLDYIDLDQQGALSAPATGHARFAANTDGTLRYYPNGGSEQTIVDTTHEHKISEVQVIKDTQVDATSPVNIGGGTNFTSGGWTTIESVSITVGGTGERSVVVSGAMTLGNFTGNSDGHTARARLYFDGVEVEVTGYSAVCANNESFVVHLVAVVENVTAGSKTLNLQAEKSGGTGSMVAWHYSAAATEVRVNTA